MKPQNMDFYDTLADAMDQNHLKTRIERVWLGGGPGENGGAGQRPGGFVGELIQTKVAYDTTEAATYVGSGTLLDNLNHIRYNIAVLSGLSASGLLTVRDADDTPTTNDVNLLTFSGAFIVTNPSPREAQVEIASGWFNDMYVNETGDEMSGDLDFIASGIGPILTSPNGMKWRVLVDDSGVLSTINI